MRKLITLSVLNMLFGLQQIIAAEAAPSAPVAAADAKVQVITLNPEILKSVDCLLTKSDINFKKEFTPASVRDGNILPSSCISIKPGGKVQIVPVSGQELKFSLAGESVQYAFDDDKFRLLNKIVDDYAPIKFKTKNDARCIIGFPAVLQNSRSTDVYLRNASVMKGKLLTDEISLYDQNLDLKYTVNKDLYTLGKGMVFAPLTKKIATGKSIIEISSISADGYKLNYNSLPLEQTGNFRIQFKGVNLDAHMALESEDGELSFIDQGLERDTILPAGKYKLSYGFVYARKEKKVAAIMLPTLKMSKFEVQPGLNKKITIGSDISILFKVYRKENKITINGWETSLEGKDGERYYSFKVIGEPEVALRVSSKKRKKLYRLGSFCLT